MREIHQPGGDYRYVLSRYEDPVASVKPGETVVIHTLDAFGDRLTSESDVPSQVLGPHANPQTGPLFVGGAEPGDTLAVDIIDIEPARDWAVSALIPHFGGLTPTDLSPALNGPLPEKVWIYRLKDGMLTRDSRLSFPWRPFLGTIGTAPEMESVSSLTPGDHGGNMDVPDTRPGNRVYLPVRVPGAYFFVGDCHAGQGDGELCGVALEISAKVTLRFEVIKGKSIGWPRIESDKEIMAVGSTRPMEDAARIAFRELIEWMTEYGWDRLEAYQALTQIGRLRVGNMVNPRFSVVAKVEKEILKAGPVS